MNKFVEYGITEEKYSNNEPSLSSGENRFIDDVMAKTKSPDYWDKGECGDTNYEEVRPTSASSAQPSGDFLNHEEVL